MKKKSHYILKVNLMSIRESSNLFSLHMLQKSVTTVVATILSKNTKNQYTVAKTPTSAVATATTATAQTTEATKIKTIPFIIDS